MLSRAHLSRYVLQDIAFVPTPVLLLFIFVRHQYCTQSMLRSCSSYKNGEDALDSGEIRAQLTIIDSGISPPISLVTYRKSMARCWIIRGFESGLMARSVFGEKNCFFSCPMLSDKFVIDRRDGSRCTLCTRIIRQN